MLTIKRITTLPALMRWRIEVLRNTSGTEPHPRLLVANRQYYRKHIADGTHIAFVAEEDGVQCGCGEIRFTNEPPSPDNPTGLCADITEIYVREPFRDQDTETLILNRLIEEARSRDCGRIARR